MQAVYFPFTWISDAEMDLVERFFPHPVILLPSEAEISDSMRRWHESGRIRWLFPVTGDGDRMGALLRDYRNWADLHQGSDISIARILEERIPFFDETSPIRIRSQIRKAAQDEPSPEPDRLLRARIFLHMAQDYDRQRVELEKELRRVGSLERTLQAHLGESEAVGSFKEGSPGPVGEDDSGRFMADERLRAWARLFFQAVSSGLVPELFVTVSRSVYQTALEAADNIERIFSGGLSGAEPERLEKMIRDLCAGKGMPEVPVPEGPFSLELVRVGGVGPVGFFSRFVRTAEMDRPVDSALSTLLAWIGKTV